MALRSLVTALLLAQPGEYVEPPPSPPPAAAPAPPAAPPAVEPPVTAPPPAPEPPPPPPPPAPPRHWAPPRTTAPPTAPPPLPPHLAPPPPPAPPQADAPPPEASPVAPAATPPARVRAGPQLVLSLAIATAAGPMHDGYSHYDLQGLVFEAEAQLGAKVTEHVFAGAYGAAGAGPAGDAAWNACEASSPDLVCDSRTLRAGILGRYDFRPAARRNPWVSAGLGIQRNGVDVPRRGGPADASERRYARGWEGRLAGGFDFGTAGSAAWGFYLGLSLGAYTDADPGPAPGDVGGPSGPNGWVTVGLRLVLPR